MTRVKFRKLNSGGKPEIVAEISELVGNQSVIVVLDVKKHMFSRRMTSISIYSKNNTKKCPVELAEKFESLGAGEIVINSVDNDALMKGYDYDLIKKSGKQLVFR